MFSRKEVAEERKQNARKKQAYHQIGIVLNRGSKKRTLNFIDTKQLVFGKENSKVQPKNILFSLGDGTTTYTRTSEYMASKMQKTLRILDLAIFVLTLINLSIWTSENETFYYNGHRFNTKVNALRGTYVLLTGIITGLIFQRSKVYIERQRHRGELRIDISFYEWEVIFWVIIELVFNAVLPIPKFDVIFHIQQRDLDTYYSLDDFLYLVAFCKLYWFKRVFHHFSIFGNDKASKTCRHYQKQADLSFAVRAHITKQPFLFESLLMICIILFFAVPLRIFERVLGGHLNDFINDMWVMTLVSSTVGYGEMTPTSNFGRLTTAIAAYIGVCLLSLLIVSMCNFFTLDGRETQAFNYLEQEGNFNNYKIAASNFIKKFLKYVVSNRKYEEKKLKKKKKAKYLAKPFLEFILYKKQFQNAKRTWKNSDEGSNQILENIKTQTDTDLTTIKNRVSKLNLDKYRQCCLTNEQAKNTFRKTQQSLELSHKLASELENLVINAHLEKMESRVDLEGPDKIIKDCLQQIKKECFQKELISKEEITNTLNAVLNELKPNARGLKAKKNNSNNLHPQ